MRKTYLLLASLLSLNVSNAAVSTHQPIWTSPITDNSRVITIGFYTDAQCSPEHQIAERKMDFSAKCFIWRRHVQTGGERDNAAGNFQCYRDRLCYRQFPGNNECKGDFYADKVFSLQCQSETGGVWAKILSGTQQCPVAPKDFQCPSSRPSAQMKEQFENQKEQKK